MSSVLTVPITRRPTQGLTIEIAGRGGASSPSAPSGYIGTVGLNSGSSYLQLSFKDASNVYGSLYGKSS